MTDQRALTRSVSVIVAALVLVAAGIVFSRPADASFHLIKIVEVYQGGQQNSEFIELQMYSSGQTAVSGKTVKVFGPNGAQTGSFTLPNNVANGTNQAHILLATEAAEFEFAVEADFRITEAMEFSGGAVCFEDVDCVAWGEYTGDRSQTGSPFSPQNGLEANQSMTRDTSGGNNPSRLDAADDTNNSAADFDHAQPTPTSNSATTSSPSGSQSQSPSSTKSPSSSGSPSPSSSGSQSSSPSTTQSPSPSSTQSASPSPTQTVSDPPNAHVTIDRPNWKQTYPARRLTVFKGTGDHRNEGQDFSVSIALVQRLESGRCKWLTASGRFVQDGCKGKREHLIPAQGSERWTYRLDKALSPSKGTRIAGYTLFAQAECNCSPNPPRADKHPFEIR